MADINAFQLSSLITVTFKPFFQICNHIYEMHIIVTSFIFVIHSQIQFVLLQPYDCKEEYNQKPEEFQWCHLLVLVISPG